MPLQKLVLTPGINRENTRYYNESGWYECDKIRFRQGTPETIGGWQPLTTDTYQGVCRALFEWVSLNGLQAIGVGTNLKFYIGTGGAYYDITPIRSTTAAGDVTFAATTGSATLIVADINHGAGVGDFVTFSGAVGLGGAVTTSVLNREYQIADVINADSYRVIVTVTANASDTGDGGAAVVGEYQINVGPEVQIPLVGWGAGTWGSGVWGTSSPSPNALRLWSQSNFGEDLVFGPRGGPIYYWDLSSGLATRAVAVTSLAGASDVPLMQNQVLVSDISRFVFAFGCNELGTLTLDPMLIRWSDQEDITNWTPGPTNQSGGIRVSKGSRIVAAVQSRQEILVFTDLAVYGLQYLGAPEVWGLQLLADGVTCMAPNVVAVAANVTYWMGKDKFYRFDGSAATLPCNVRQFVFSDMNLSQREQFFAGIVERFNEVWWYYCSANSTVVDRYVVYNYVESVWYYGTLGRTAWLDSTLSSFPLAATYDYTLVQHENGVDDDTNGEPRAINAYIETSEWGLEGGENYIFIRRMLPDITFEGSTSGSSPQVTLTIKPMQNSGSGYTTPASVGGNSNAVVTRIATAPIEEFTGQVFIRSRGRQFVMRLESDTLGTAWQMGAMRVDTKPDGKRG